MDDETKVKLEFKQLSSPLDNPYWIGGWRWYKVYTPPPFSEFPILWSVRMDYLKPYD